MDAPTDATQHALGATECGYGLGDRITRLSGQQHAEAKEPHRPHRFQGRPLGFYVPSRQELLVARSPGSLRVRQTLRPLLSPPCQLRSYRPGIGRSLNSTLVRREQSLCSLGGHPSWLSKPVPAWFDLPATRFLHFRGRRWEGRTSRDPSTGCYRPPPELPASSEGPRMCSRFQAGSQWGGGPWQRTWKALPRRKRHLYLRRNRREA